MINYTIDNSVRSMNQQTETSLLDLHCRGSIARREGLSANGNWSTGKCGVTCYPYKPFSPAHSTQFPLKKPTLHLPRQPPPTIARSAISSPIRGNHSLIAFLVLVPVFFDPLRMPVLVQRCFFRAIWFGSLFLVFFVFAHAFSSNLAWALNSSSSTQPAWAFNLWFWYHGRGGFSRSTFSDRVTVATDWPTFFTSGWMVAESLKLFRRLLFFCFPFTFAFGSVFRGKQVVSISSWSIYRCLNSDTDHTVPRTAGSDRDPAPDTGPN